MPERLCIRQLDHPSGDLLNLEIVERKGLGHPIRSVMENCRTAEFGAIPPLSVGIWQDTFNLVRPEVS